MLYDLLKHNFVIGKKPCKFTKHCVYESFHVYNCRTMQMFDVVIQFIKVVSKVFFSFEKTKTVHFWSLNVLNK
jgi:hypothetical protein